MTKLSLHDLKILHLGMTNAGNFDETDIEKSDLKKIGVGRILDRLGSLKERKLIGMNKDGSFFITESARHILWDKEIPLWVRILRILEIKPNTSKEISSLLLLNEDQVFNTIEELRKNQLILMSPMREEKEIIKMYEILPEGLEAVQKVVSREHMELPKAGTQIESISLLEETIKEIKKISEISDKKKLELLRRLEKIKEQIKKKSF